MTTTTTEGTTLKVRGMVCDRCIDVVRAELNRLGLEVAAVSLGQVTINGSLNEDDLNRIDQALDSQGFGLLQDQKPTTHQRAKAFLDAHFKQADLSESKIGTPNRRLSAQLQRALGLDYDTISSQFAKTEGMTVEKYVINQRIDKVKEWLAYSDNTLTDIAYRTGYSSVQHLSNQFRQVTGLTPSYFRQVRDRKLVVQHQVDSQKPS
ncbi:AraC family transcriptional regulator [Spirosoma luteum]|uniref:AraC family transcriptional regulator n=1 Tax=Spirosoma luteum TaxID=431553 RepID=UPI000361BB49|nr:helix-turn-helix domain-containing protein [Spirosoma luteum]